MIRQAKGGNPRWQQRELQPFIRWIIDAELAQELGLKPFLFGAKATVELQVTDHTEGLEIARVLIVGLLVKVSHGQEIAARRGLKLRWARRMRSPPKFYPLKKVGQRFIRLPAGPLTSLTAPLCFMLDL